MIRKILVSLLIGAAPIGVVVAQSVQVTTAAADVPVKKVMLFSSGVGYFEHAGAVHGNSATQLRFKTNQINDILKSLMLQDQDGGRVGVITYPSQDPIAKTLRSFQIDITKNPSLADLLNQLRGAKVTIQSQAERMTGTILGVEVRRKPAEKGEVVEVPVLNLLAGASIRAVELQTINNLTLDDAQLQDELTKALSALVVARDQDKKPVTINFNGAGDRRVRIGYVVETPVWKTSYRLLLDDKGQVRKVAGLGDRREPDGERLERRVAVAGERAADVVHDGSLPAALRDAAERRSGDVRRFAAAGIRRRNRRRTRACGHGSAAASSAGAAPNRLRAGREAAGDAADRGRHDCQPMPQRDRHRAVASAADVGRIDGVDRGARRAVSVHGRQCHAAATEVGDDSDHHRQRRDRTRVDLQRVGAAEQSAEWRAAQEHHRQAPACRAR